MQSFYIVILYKSDLTSVQYTDSNIEEMRNWRRVFGHDVTYYDTVKHQTLTQRVCTNSRGLHLSANQALNANRLNNYLTPLIGEGSPLGLTMCVIS